MHLLHLEVAARACAVTAGALGQIAAASGRLTLRARAVFGQDVAKNGGKGRDADAGANEHNDRIVENVLAGCAVGPIDAKEGPTIRVQFTSDAYLGVMEWVEVIFKVAGPVAQTLDVHRHEVLVRGGCDAEGMPLDFGEGGALQEKVLSGHVAHASRGVAELDAIHIGLLLVHGENSHGPERSNDADDSLHRIEKNRNEHILPRSWFGDDRLNSVQHEENVPGPDELVDAVEDVEACLSELVAGGDGDGAEDKTKQPAGHTRNGEQPFAKGELVTVEPVLFPEILGGGLG
mmetsp:Transcript_36820/g.85567  ORF Transcript_36820/g.85567 Transcript_36820/m.85567 type:complete len:290 (-) Transcript_36820:361-1230(-)